MAEAAPKQTYRGNCHCGAFVYEADLPEIKSVFVCNCSICTRQGYRWLFVPSAGDVRFVKGDEGGLTEYQFGAKNLGHAFCPTCGTSVAGRRPAGPDGKIGALNARTLQDLDIWSLEATPFDGASLGDAHVNAEYDGPEPAAEMEGARIYKGSCHCGAVRLAFKSKPLDESSLTTECNCSICQRHGYVWSYPGGDQIAVQGEDNLAAYQFGRGMVAKKFCKTCSTPVFNDFLDLSDEELARLPEGTQAFYRSKRHVRPVNLRTMHEFDEIMKAVKLTRLNGWDNVEPKYVNP